MTITTRRIAALAVAGLMGGAFNPTAVQAKATAAAIAPAFRVSKRQLLRAGMGNVIRWGYCDGPGWTVAQVKRMAKKAKNRAKHRAACRRAKA